jgi:hypothetical protein
MGAGTTDKRVLSLNKLSSFYTCTLLLVMLLSSQLFTLRAHAQTSYGSVVGTVTDKTGASVAGARVTLKNSGTNATQTFETGSGGNYVFPNLTPGTYSVTVSQKGFEAFTLNRLDVQIGGATRADIALSVGNVAETVTVTTAQAQLQTDSASLSGVIEGQQILEAPLNGRNVNNLLDFVPGVIPGGGTSGNTMANGGSGNFQAGSNTQAIAYGNYQIGGAFSGQSLFFIDGVGSNVPENNVNALVPTQDAVQEFRVSTSLVSAEFGGYGGGVIEISTKSGTNTFHGSAYEYVRNTDLEANDWFSKHDGLAKSPLHQNQFGANVGGPGLKNKLFFFFSWEHEALATGAPEEEVMPTTAELAGNFAGEQTIYNTNYGTLNTPNGQPFPGNSIAAFIDPTALKILQLETPDESKVTQTPGVPNFFANAPIKGDQTQYNARVDANLSKDNLFARYTFWNPHNSASDPEGNKTGGGPTGNSTQEGVFGENHVFNPTTIAELRLSYLENYNFQNLLSAGYDLGSLNSAYTTIQSEGPGGVGVYPNIAIQGYSVGAQSSTLFWNNDVWAINGSITKILRRHTIKAGANWRQTLWEAYGGPIQVTLNSTPYFTASSVSDATTGNALASFLLGIPSSTSTTYGSNTHTFAHNYGFYVTDTFQVTPKLSITAGLRWEQPGAYSEEQNLSVVLQPNAPVSIGSLSSITNPVTGDTVPLTGQLAFVDSPQYSSRRQEELHWELYSPRLGLAYRIDPKTVVRSGYGISFLPADMDQAGPQLSQVVRAATSNTNTWGEPLNASVANPLPNGVNKPLGRSQSVLDSLLGVGLWARESNVPYGYTQQWNLAAERQLNQNSTLTVAYAGAKGTHLLIATPYTGSGFQRNQLPDSYDSLGAALQNQVTNPFYGVLPASNFLGSPTIAEGYLLLPHPQYPEGLLQQAPRYGSSTYHALQVGYIQRFGHAGTLQGAYTWGKVLSDTDNTSEFQDGQGNTGERQDEYNPRAEKSISLQDIANNLVINYGVDLPFGHKEPYLSDIGGIANAVIGGWRVNGITTFRSGVPIALTAPANGLSQFDGGTPGFGPGIGNTRPDYIAGCNKGASGSPHSNARVNEWFNTSCFTPPDNYSFGNEPRVDPTMKSEGLDNWDFSLNKAFDITEHMKLKFAADFFDLFNHAQFGLPGEGVPQVANTGNLGQINSQSNLPRTVQLSLRLSF